MKAQHIAAAALALAGGYLAVLVGARRWHQHWGATDEEIARPLPGDDLIADCKLVHRSRFSWTPSRQG
jgi:hypothetical protein